MCEEEESDQMLFRVALDVLGLRVLNLLLVRREWGSEVHCIIP